ncbi:trypsin-like peptidase domain-containing protein [Dorea formicigenerans]|uniref:S1C family serine protease n=1 Tax=Dorea formicigenerans TaxID=39486 RepID=UPI001D05EB90|nr:trypsin-like peptidase domain-containing protein [Dorea formicigenerans]MCC3184669.1 trypsin-like peptidase domain-containing protein [[Clostridium] innocuum]MCB6283369.1 trypsin-like peptidase domain-containing protein [Dorea formicigenerans]MCB6380337.1 trypsin-like peptidase domain-containing protein [Dorea formicigenerans]MCB6383278.1 trypsin-like peptidase domain-containing protein [Dorea formicigenerans]MCB6388474.1 trypsin-like peptidase domain-containing protein [Dorea formicigenera
MENQYTYYKPEPDDMNGMNEETPKPKKNRKVPKPVKLVCAGVAFGLVASVTFQTGNYVGTKVFGTTTTNGKTAKTAQTVDGAKLTTSSSSTGTSDVATIAKNAMPSIVSITNMSVQEVQSFFGGTQQQESTSVGSGIIIGQTDSELLILTNNHVVEGNEKLTVSFVDNESVEANVKGTDSTKDLAVVAVKISDVKDSTMDEIAVATMGDSSKLEVGEQVVAIGNALGYGQSVTSGIVSATERTLDGYEGGTLIQTDAAINPGNSGGALLNPNGEVIGINTAKVATDSVEGMGYAIPISDASDTIQNLMNQETKTKVSEAEQGYLGIQGVDVSDESAKMYNMPTGVYISDVVKNGGAQQAGLTKGSVITGLEGTTISDMNSLKEQLQYYRVGDKVKVTVQVPGNNGEYTEKTVEVTLGSKS